MERTGAIRYPELSAVLADITATVRSMTGRAMLDWPARWMKPRWTGS